MIRSNKKISVFRVIGLKILGRIGTILFLMENYNFMHFERHFAFQSAYNFFPPENLKKV